MDVFRLIKSLSGNEKRFFRLQSAMIEGEKTYLRLFDLIDRSNKYDEEKTREELDPGMTKARFSKEKNHLATLILRHMNRYQHKHSAHLQISELIGGVKFLFDKGLYQDSRKTLNKAIKLIDKYDLEAYKFIAFSWEKRLFEIGAYTQNQSTASSIAKAQRDAFMEHLNTTEYSNLYDQITTFRITYGRIRDQKARDAIAKVMEHPLMMETIDDTSFNAEYYRLHTHFNYHELLGEWGDAIVYAEQLVQLLEGHPNQLRIRYEPYISNLFNLLRCQMRSTQFANFQGDWTIHDTFYNNLQKLVNLPTTEIFNTIKSETLVTWHETHVKHIKLNYCGMMLLFEEIVAMDEEIEKFIRKYAHADSLDRLSFAINVSTAAFFCQEYRLARKWLNRLLNSQEMNVRSDLYNFCRVYNLLVNFELQDFDQLEYISVSTKRHLRSRNAFFKVETLLSTFFLKEAIAFNSRADIVKGFQQLKSNLKPLMEDSNEKRVFEIFNFIDWIDGHIQNKPALQIARERQQPWKASNPIPLFEEVTQTVPSTAKRNPHGTKSSSKNFRF